MRFARIAVLAMFSLGVGSQSFPQAGFRTERDLLGEKQIPAEARRARAHCLGYPEPPEVTGSSAAHPAETAHGQGDPENVRRVLTLNC